jgi:hypothetical protein
MPLQAASSHLAPQLLQLTLAKCICAAAAPPPPTGPPLQPIVPINLLDQNGFPVRNDNLTNFAYVGPNDGRQQPPEIYSAFRPANPSDPTPIPPGETAQLRNQQTGKYCRLAQLPTGYPLYTRITSSSKRGLLQVPGSCNTQGVLCDQDTIATATILTYTGYGMSYNGVPLVQSPGSKTLLLTADPACTTPGGDRMTFPPAILGESQ